MDTSYMKKWAYVKSLRLLPKEDISIFPSEVEQLCFSTGPGKKTYNRELSNEACHKTPNHHRACQA